MERSRIAEFAAKGGLELRSTTDIVIGGCDPILPTPFHLGEGAATALALVGQEVSDARVDQGHRPQSLRVDTAHAAASLNSYQFLQAPEAGTPPRTVPPVTAIYPCLDGRYIHLHGSFTGAAGILDILGLGMDATAEDISRATSSWDAFALEDAIAEKKLCGAAIRSNAEWLATAQGQDLAARPVVQLTKIGEAPPEPFPGGPRPLSGVRVLDLTRVLAGPTSARTLAEHGADVLHIASPNLPTFERFEMDTGHGKRQAHIDLDDPAQAATLKDLAREADVFSQGFRLGALARRGFGPEQLAELRPGIVYVSENCFGSFGPWAHRPGWEQLGQSVAGVAMVQGGSGKPVLAPAALNDYTTGYFAALGAVMALRRRAKEGGSWLVTVSLTRTSMWYYGLGLELDRGAATGLGEVSRFMERHETAWGPIDHISPPLQMSETQPRWELPTAPLGTHGPGWLPR